MTIAPWLFPCLLAVLFWGVSTFLPKITIRKLPPFHLSIYSYSFFLLGSIVMQGFYGFHIDFDLRGVLLAMSVGIVGGIAQILYYVSLRTNSVTYSVVITSLYPAVATLLAFLTLGEEISWRQGAGIILGLLSLILMVKASDSKAES